jgi:hypothetical protein
VVAAVVLGDRAVMRVMVAVVMVTVMVMVRGRRLRHAGETNRKRGRERKRPSDQPAEVNGHCDAPFVGCPCF